MKKKQAKGAEAHRPSNIKDSPTDFLAPIDGPELVFALVAPIGTDLKLVSRVLRSELERVGYKVSEIHLTDFLAQQPIEIKIKSQGLEKRYDEFIRAGNRIRRITGRADFFSLLSVAAIKASRFQVVRSRRKPAPKHAYILNQFKRPEEITTLRQVYGRAFFQISAYCPKERRLERLTTLIAESYSKERRDEAYKGAAYDLVVRDEAEEEEEFGQRVRDTFPLADVIINAESEASIQQTCSRFVRVYFGDPFVTPSRDEQSINFARAVASRSADLSRQVGAVICTQEGEIISTGCNDVPKAGGGLYWEGDQGDTRDFQLGYDPSVKVKNDILQDVFRRLKKGWLNDEKRQLEISELAATALHKGRTPLMKDAPLMDILEFGRIVHAEMAAITEAARLGRSLKGATLYCTTFPCHICARHIVASGIERVVYIEPYAKSLAATLYADSIHVDGMPATNESKVRFEHFVGIAPPRYAEIFGKGRRKDKLGRADKWDESKAKPLLERLVPSYMLIESVVATGLKALLAEFKNKLN